MSCGTGWSAKVLHRRSDIVAAVATPRPLTLSKKTFFEHIIINIYFRYKFLLIKSFGVDSFYEKKIVKPSISIHSKPHTRP